MEGSPRFPDTSSGQDSEELSSDAYQIPPGSRLETALDGETDLPYFLRGLPERAQEIILRRNGLGGHDKTTLDRTGQLLGLSRERIRQLENLSLHRLGILVAEARRYRQQG